MADVQPLRGMRYHREKVGDLAQVITPPFDVISAEAQARYYERNPYNVIRLELNRAQADDSTLDNVYTRAAATFAEWRLQGILYEETAPGYYLYQQRFTYASPGTGAIDKPASFQSYTRTSLLARVRLEPWEARVVLPHENTHTKAKEDRLNLLRACSTNFSPIMSLYDDPQARIRRLLASYAEQAEVQVSDEVGEEHRLQPITDRQQLALIQDFFRERQLYIADGHHRYTTALAYRDEIRRQQRELHPMDGVNFVLMALIDMDDPGMLVLPTHRLLRDLPQDTLNALSPEHFERYFSVQMLDSSTASEIVLEQLAQAGSQALAVKTAAQTLLLRLNEQGKRRMGESTHSDAWNRLDVSLVQLLLLEDILGISAEDVAAGRYVYYTHDTRQALQSLQNGEAQAVILLNSTPLRQVCDVAQADDRMPQKSTYIYPKLATGLVMNPLW